MSSNEHKSTLEQLIAQHGLDENSSYWRRIKLCLERGMLTDAPCKALLIAAERAIQHQQDYPEHLHRPPTAEQLHAAGEPHVRLGTLLDDTSLIVGVRFDRPLHVVVAGCTGFGKTTLVRTLLKTIHEFNQCHFPDPSR